MGPAAASAPLGWGERAEVFFFWGGFFCRSPTPRRRDPLGGGGGLRGGQDGPPEPGWAGERDRGRGGGKVRRGDPPPKMAAQPPAPHTYSP